jgi:class 3 adenylate cyclase
MFIDRHDLPGVTPEDLANAHRQDLMEQGAHDVKYHTYWFDPDTGSVFCLAEGPSADAVVAVHRESHGIVASSILELTDDTPLNSFFGAIPNFPAGTAYVAPAMRVIVFTDLCGSVAQTQQLGDDGHIRLLREHDEIVRTRLTAHDGREVKHTGDGIMAAFTSVVASIEFAKSVQRMLQDRNAASEHPIEISIGIRAGEPVTGDNDDLFGAAVQIAARLCAAAPAGEINVSMAVHELCAGKMIEFSDCGKLALKGVPEPMQAYSVAWRDESD